MKRENQEEILDRHNYYGQYLLTGKVTDLTHHVDSFITLMLNYDKALEYTEESMNSTGQAMEKFSAYEDSVAGHTELFNKSIQDLANTAIDSGLINFFIDLGTTGVKTLDNIIESLTPLGTLGLGAGLFAGFKNVGRDKKAFPYSCFKYADSDKCSLGY